MENFETFYNQRAAQFELNEGFKESLINSLLALFSMGAAVYEGNYILNFLNKQPAPLEQKIEALNTIKDKTTDQKFKKAANNAIQILTKSAHNVKQDISNDKSRILDLAVDFTLPNEILGNDIHDKANDKFMRPYLDDVNNWTVGVGHLIGDGSDSDKNKWIENRKNQGKSIVLSRQEAKNQFKQDLEKHYRLAQQKFQNEWNKFPDDLKITLIDISFRGDLQKTKGGDFNFVNLIKKGNYKKAAKEYLDHTEYKQRKGKRNLNDGVVKRMNRNATIISSVT